MQIPQSINDIDKVERAISEATAYAYAKGVPLTLERLACALGISVETISHIINDRCAANSKEGPHTEAIQALKNAVNLCRADIMEHGMVRGNSPIMPIFALKANHGYKDTPDNVAQNPVVVIVGSAELQD